MVLPRCSWKDVADWTPTIVNGLWSSYWRDTGFAFHPNASNTHACRWKEDVWQDSNLKQIFVPLLVGFAQQLMQLSNRQSFCFQGRCFMLCFHIGMRTFIHLSGFLWKIPHLSPTESTQSFSWKHYSLLSLLAPPPFCLVTAKHNHF